MKSLKEHLNEGLLDIEDTINNHEELICHFLDTNYRINGTYTIKNGVVDVDGDVTIIYKKLQERQERLVNDLFVFGTVTGNFYCSESRKLKSLKGAPKEVGGSFYCEKCNSLTSLEGAPEHCSTFNCIDCTSLKTLEGAPEKCVAFNCLGCASLTSLKGGPKYCGRFECCECGSLKSLKYGPKTVEVYKVDKRLRDEVELYTKAESVIVVY